MQRGFIVALFAFSFSHCSGNEKGSSSLPQQPLAAETPQVSNATEQMLFDAAGYAGAIGIAIWPEHWSKLSELGKAIDSRLPEKLRGLHSMVEAELLHKGAPWKFLNKAAGQVGFEQLPELLPGLDTSRPIVASLLRPLSDFEALGSTYIAQRIVPMGMHSRVVLPAHDSHAISSAIAEALQKTGLKLETDEGHTAILRSDSLVVRLQAAKLWLSVDFVHGRHLASLPLSSFDVPATKTAADARFASSTPAIARLLIRNHAIERTGSYQGMSNVLSVLGSVPSKQRHPIFVEGYSEILSLPALMDPRGQASTDTLIEVSLATPNIRILFALTTAGRKAWSAGLPTQGSAPLHKVDWSAIFAAAPMPPALASLSFDQALEMHYMGGYGASLYTAGANAIALGKRWQGEERSKRPREIEALSRGIAGFREASLRLHGALLIFDLLGDQPLPTLPTTDSEGPISAANICYHDALEAMRLAFINVYRPELAATLSHQLKDNLACAEKGEQWKERVAAVRELLSKI